MVWAHGRSCTSSAGSLRMSRASKSSNRMPLAVAGAGLGQVVPAVDGVGRRVPGVGPQTVVGITGEVAGVHVPDIVAADCGADGQPRRRVGRQLRGEIVHEHAELHGCSPVSRSSTSTPARSAATRASAPGQASHRGHRAGGVNTPRHRSSSDHRQVLEREFADEQVVERAAGADMGEQALQASEVDDVLGEPTGAVDPHGHVEGGGRREAGLPGQVAEGLHEVRTLREGVHGDHPGRQGGHPARRQTADDELGQDRQCLLGLVVTGEPDPQKAQGLVASVHPGQHVGADLVLDQGVDSALVESEPAVDQQTAAVDHDPGDVVPDLDVDGQAGQRLAEPGDLVPCPGGEGRGVDRSSAPGSDQEDRPRRGPRGPTRSGPVRAGARRPCR